MPFGDHTLSSTSSGSETESSGSGSSVQRMRFSEPNPCAGEHQRSQFLITEFFSSISSLYAKHKIIQAYVCQAPGSAENIRLRHDYVLIAAMLQKILGKIKYIIQRCPKRQEEHPTEQIRSILEFSDDRRCMMEKLTEIYLVAERAVEQADLRNSNVPRTPMEGNLYEAILATELEGVLLDVRVGWRESSEEIIDREDIGKISAYLNCQPQYLQDCLEKLSVITDYLSHPRSLSL